MKFYTEEVKSEAPLWRGRASELRRRQFVAMHACLALAVSLLICACMILEVQSSNATVAPAAAPYAPTSAPSDLQEVTTGGRGTALTSTTQRKPRAATRRRTSSASSAAAAGSSSTSTTTQQPQTETEPFPATSTGASVRRMTTPFDDQEAQDDADSAAEAAEEAAAAARWRRLRNRKNKTSVSPSLSSVTPSFSSTTTATTINRRHPSTTAASTTPASGATVSTQLPSNQTTTLDDNAGNQNKTSLAAHQQASSKQGELSSALLNALVVGNKTMGEVMRDIRDEIMKIEDYIKEQGNSMKHLMSAASCPAAPNAQATNQTTAPTTPAPASASVRSLYLEPANVSSPPPPPLLRDNTSTGQNKSVAGPSNTTQVASSNITSSQLPSPNNTSQATNSGNTTGQVTTQNNTSISQTNSPNNTAQEPIVVRQQVNSVKLGEPIGPALNTTNKTKTRDNRDENPRNDDSIREQNSSSLKHFIIICSISVVIATSLVVALIILLLK